MSYVSIYLRGKYCSFCQGTANPLWLPHDYTMNFIFNTSLCGYYNNGIPVTAKSDESGICVFPKILKFGLNLE